MIILLYLLTVNFTTWVFDPTAGVIALLLDICYILVRKPAVRHKVKHHAKRVVQRGRRTKPKKRK